MTPSTRRSTTTIASLLSVALGLAGVARAQDIPEGQSCGGLVCDLGLFGHKVPPKPTTAAPIPAAAQPASAPARVLTRPEPRAAAVAEPRKSAIHRKTRVAKAAPGPTAPDRPAAVAPVLGTPPLPAGLAPSALPTALAAPAVPAATRPSVTATAAPHSPAPAVPPTVATQPARSPIDAVLGPQPEAASLTAVPAGIPAPATEEEPVVLANPYVSSQPLRPRFQSVDPTVR